jgi:copper(I)-binding protein
MKLNLFAVAMLMAGAQAQACGELTIADAWVRLAPPNAPVMAGYLTLSNAGVDPVMVTGGSSDSFERVELHDMTHENGVMKMRKLDQIEVVAGGNVELAPGGMHLMLIGPKRTFAAGDSVEVKLRVCAETDQTVSFVVREAAPEGKSAHAGHEHH